MVDQLSSSGNRLCLTRGPDGHHCHRHCGVADGHGRMGCGSLRQRPPQLAELDLGSRLLRNTVPHVARRAPPRTPGLRNTVDDGDESATAVRSRFAVGNPDDAMGRSLRSPDDGAHSGCGDLRARVLPHVGGRTADAPGGVRIADRSAPAVSRARTRRAGPVLHQARADRTVAGKDSRLRWRKATVFQANRPDGRTARRTPARGRGEFAPGRPRPAARAPCTHWIHDVLRGGSISARMPDVRQPASGGPSGHHPLPASLALALRHGGDPEQPRPKKRSGDPGARVGLASRRAPRGHHSCVRSATNVPSRRGVPDRSRDTPGARVVHRKRQAHPRHAGVVGVAGRCNVRRNFSHAD